MAYAVAWNEAAPVGSSTSADTLDTELQNLKKSIRERMNDILGNVWETDANDPKAIDYPLGIAIHWSIGHIDRGSSTSWDASGGDRAIHPSATTTTVILYIPIPMKTGITLASVKARVDRDTGATVVLDVKRVDNAGSETNMGTSTSASTGYHDLSVSSLAHTVLADTTYLARVTLTSDGVSSDSAILLYIQAD